MGEINFFYFYIKILDFIVLYRLMKIWIKSSFFGVGAPEALVVGILSLAVFGPKGLANSISSFGKIFRSFQPTIQEISTISTDLRSTFNREIGIKNFTENELVSSFKPYTLNINKNFPSKMESATSTNYIEKLKNKKKTKD